MSTTLSAYRTPPQQERKAATELRGLRIRAYVPMETRERRAGRKTVLVRVPVAPSYVFTASAKPAGDLKHVRERVPGSIRVSELSPLYALARERPARQMSPFKPGQSVIIAKGRFAELRAKVTEVRGRTCIIAYDLLGKTHTQAIAYTQLRPG